MRITKRAYAKINWALDVLGRREDGFHELDMLMQTIALYDELTLENAGALSLTVDGRHVPSDGRNLILRAAEALNAFTGAARGAHIVLQKHIPVRAGLGGGSADCAAALLALNRLWGLNLSLHTLIEIGATLGSDVPFLMGTGLARVRGVGEKLLRMKAGKALSLVIVQPGAGLSTAQVFARWDALGGKRLFLDMDGAQAALMQGDMARFFAMTGNALEPPAMDMMDAVRDARAQLLAQGAAFAQMSGSGSAVFGVFSSPEQAHAAAAHIGSRAIATQTYP